jgi:hypothetical protein
MRVEVNAPTGSEQTPDREGTEEEKASLSLSSVPYKQPGRKKHGWQRAGPLAEEARGKQVWRPTFTVYVTAVWDNLSSYLLFSTHSNRTYRGRKSVRRMGMGGNSGRENGELYGRGRGLEACNGCAFTSSWLQTPTGKGGVRGTCSLESKFEEVIMAEVLIGELQPRYVSADCTETYPSRNWTCSSLPPAPAIPLSRGSDEKHC